QSLYLQLKSYYPDADCQETYPPFGGPAVLYTCRISDAHLSSIQGLHGLYYAGQEGDGEAQAQVKDLALRLQWPADAPLSLPFSAEWQGVLSAETYGEYGLALDAPAEAQVYLNETLLLETPAEGGRQEGRITLAKGNHNLRVRAVGGEGLLDLQWQPPRGSWETIPRTALYVPPVTNNGLLGRYFANGHWAEPPAFTQIDPRLALYFHIIPLPRPYTVEWVGKVRAAVDGDYRFGVESIDESQVYINGALVAESPGANKYGEGGIRLAAGLHDVRILFADRTSHTHINFWWTPPGGSHEVVPPEALLPPQGRYEPSALSQRTAPQLPPTAAVPTTGVQATFDRLVPVEGLLLPRDVAVDAQGYLYLADTGNDRVLKLTADGEVVWAVEGHGDAPFGEPWAVEVARDGALWVLDAETAWVYAFQPDGIPLQRVGGPSLGAFHPRGLALTPQGNVVVVDTGGSRLMELSPDGGTVREVGWPGSGPGALGQPTEALVAPSGYLYVVDTENGRIQLLTPEAVYAGEWAIAGSTTVDHPHMAWGPRDEIYLSEPEPGTVAVFNGEGALLGRWGMRGSAADQWQKPQGLAADGQGHVYVVDTYQHRLQRFLVQHGEE
ncbi:MAG: hypothetical protein GX605_06890, partial [Chloroflexi bacterium]|nr:hypothetical protein [Chloroflexota bacterium]